MGFKAWARGCFACSSLTAADGEKPSAIGYQPASGYRSGDASGAQMCWAPSGIPVDQAHADAQHSARRLL
jgi:hypothetical protein